jgi:hypothetical protein
MSEINYVFTYKLRIHIGSLNEAWPALQNCVTYHYLSHKMILHQKYISRTPLGMTMMIAHQHHRVQPTMKLRQSTRTTKYIPDYSKASPKKRKPPHTTRKIRRSQRLAKILNACGDNTQFTETNPTRCPDSGDSVPPIVTNFPDY